MTCQVILRDLVPGGFAGCSGTDTGCHPAMILACVRACALSSISGNRRRNSTAAANSPPRSNAARIAAASSSLTVNIARACTTTDKLAIILPRTSGPSVRVAHKERIERGFLRPEAEAEARPDADLARTTTVQDMTMIEYVRARTTSGECGPAISVPNAAERGVGDGINQRASGLPGRSEERRLSCRRGAGRPRDWTIDTSQSGAVGRRSRCSREAPAAPWNHLHSHQPWRTMPGRARGHPPT